MGLALRYNLFYGVDAEAVYGGIVSFWVRLGFRLLPTPLRPLPELPFDAYVLYRPRGGWTLLAWDSGWEWARRRQAQLHVSRTLGCSGLLVFVYDGEYWGYELFNSGREVDHFVQDPDGGGWFPGRDCVGSPQRLVAQFPARGLRPTDVSPYLVRNPDPSDLAREWNTVARAGDEFTRGDECAVVDFLRTLGVGIELRRHGDDRRYVTPLAQPWKAFKTIHVRRTPP
jgi:hypothetical protein